MKKIFNWMVSVSLLFITASVLFYILHYYLFRDAHHIFIYMIGDFGFLFIDVLLVVLFIERILSRREKPSLMKKLNMVIGTFFSEVGFEFLKITSSFVHNSEELSKQLKIDPQWSSKEFKTSIEATSKFSYEIRLDQEKLPELRDFLVEKRAFMLRLLENPNLLEHDRFSDLLLAVFHLTEELAFRENKLLELPQADLTHIAVDLQRAYSQIIQEWIHYISHLKDSYPFLFSFAVRINPMNSQSSVIFS